MFPTASAAWPLRRLAVALLALPALALAAGCGSDGGDGGGGSLVPQGARSTRGIYVADTGNHRIVRMEGENFPLTNWETLGTQGAGVRQFNNPSEIVVGTDHRLYIADTGNNRIVRMDNIHGDNWIEFGGSGQFSQPRGLDVAPDGKIYIADTGNNRIVRLDGFNGAGLITLTTVGGLGGLNGPTDVEYLARDNQNNLNTDVIVIADRGNNRVLVTPSNFSASGNLRYGKADNTAGGGRAELNQPSRISAGGPYITISDTGNNRMVLRDLTNANTVIESAPASMQLNQPWAVEPWYYSGDLIADTGNHRIVRGSIDFVNAPSVIAAQGTQGSGAFQFNRPEGVSDGWELARVPTSIRIEPSSSITLGVGETRTVTAEARIGSTVLPTDPTKWTWTSSNPGIARVTTGGNPRVITGVAPGTTQIQVLSEYGNTVVGTINVTVTTATGGVIVPIK